MVIHTNINYLKEAIEHFIKTYEYKPYIFMNKETIKSYLQQSYYSNSLDNKCLRYLDCKVIEDNEMSLGEIILR